VTKLVAQGHARADGKSELLSPAVGYFRPALAPGALVTPGAILGKLEVLGVLHVIVASGDHSGVIVGDADRRARIPVGFGTPLFEIDPNAVATGVAPAVPRSQTARGLVFLAPSSGRFYRRSAPDKPYFVEVGGTLSDGQPVGLLEVMKTFHRVSYGGDGLPSPAKVKAILVEDGADIETGDAILEVEPG
jgi:acetyl-CoA carboxylase biotin carboxyl carrier protein